MLPNSNRKWTSSPICISSEPWCHFWQWHDTGSTCKQYCECSFYHINNIGSIRNHLIQEAAVTLIHVHVTSRVDYCNALLYDLSYKILYKKPKMLQQGFLQVQINLNTFTPVLNNLHWLPVKFRIHFKILLLTFKTYHGLAPSDLCDLIDKKLPTYSLRNYDDFQLVEPRTKLKTYGDRAFSKAAPFLWNPLPIDILRSPNVACFKQRLKPYLFKLTFTPVNQDLFLSQCYWLWKVLLSNVDTSAL